MPTRTGALLRLITAPEIPEPRSVGSDHLAVVPQLVRLRATFRSLAQRGGQTLVMLPERLAQAPPQSEVLLRELAASITASRSRGLRPWRARWPQSSSCARAPGTWLRNGSLRPRPRARMGPKAPTA